MTRIGLLECDHVDERWLSIGGDYHDMFDKLLAPHGIELVSVDARNGVLPSSPGEFDGYVVTGSRFSVYDDEPWIRDLSAMLRDIAAAEVPAVGICFGHQLLARALGGVVEKASTGWGVGPHAVDSPLGKLQLHFMHQDQVVGLPDGAVVIGSADHCPVAMFRVGERVLGVQAHPEFDAAYVDALMSARVERIGAERVAAARRVLGTPTDHDAVGAWIAAFLSGRGAIGR